MKMISYLKDKFVIIVLNMSVILLVFLILYLFKVTYTISIFITLILFVGLIISLFYDYYRKSNFYNTMEKVLLNLDKKYLIAEIIERPNFLEGNLFLDYLYDIDKSYIEKLNKYKFASEEFKEYIELWCHEIKTPIATSKLMVENNNTKSMLEELDRIEQYVEQVLYFARSEIVEKDYIIKETSLKEVINNVVFKNKLDIMSKKIKIEIFDNDFFIESDSKWLVFIINQIIVNSIKYCKEKDSRIKINCEEYKNNIILNIEDNGIGINKDEIEKIFDKGFTGTNGRKKYNSTGIGLYLCKKLCEKLNHSIHIRSVINEKTIVTIVFPKSSLISNIK